jgi:hypothetical protein
MPGQNVAAASVLQRRRLGARRRRPHVFELQRWWSVADEFLWPARHVGDLGSPEEAAEVWCFDGVTQQLRQGRLSAVAVMTGQPERRAK